MSLPSMRLHSNQRLCDGGTNQNIGQRFAVSFSESSAGTTWSFRVAIDSGYGYVVYGDGLNIGQMNVDVWSGDTNPKEYTISNAAAGAHTLEVYGAEGCCDGEAGGWQFRRASGVWTDLTVANLNQACQSAPRLSYFSTNLASNSGNQANKNVIESRYLSGTTGSGYCSRSLSNLYLHSNSEMCSGGSNSNIGQRFQISFEENGGGATWRFKLNIDAGYGYVVYVDGLYFGQIANDVWTSGTNPFTYILPNVGLGPHMFVVYGGEGCCDGEAGRWQVDRNFQGLVDITDTVITSLSAQTDSSYPRPTVFTNSLSYFSTFLPENRGSVADNKNFIEASRIRNVHGGNGYCTKSLTTLSSHSNQVVCGGGSNSNIGQSFAVTFVEPQGGVPWAFRIYMDSGYGYSVYYDGSTLVGQKTQDVWSGSTNPGSWTITSVDAGVHTFTVYGGEGCCDGEAGAWTFSRANVAYVALTQANLDAASKSSRISYFSTLLPSNQGSPRNNQFWIENKFINKQTNSGYCSQTFSTLTNHANKHICSGGSASNIGQRFQISFFENQGGVNWDFRVYMDSGYGHVAYADGAFLNEKTGDVWAGATNPTVYTMTSVAKGHHTFVVYGGEGCCDGEAGDWKFQRNGAGYRDVSTSNLNAAS